MNNREIWEGWTVQDMIDELEPLLDMVMSGRSFVSPFESYEELVVYIASEQPYYKKPIPEVNGYFRKKYKL